MLHHIATNGNAFLAENAVHRLYKVKHVIPLGRMRKRCQHCRQHLRRDGSIHRILHAAAARGICTEEFFHLQANLVADMEGRVLIHNRLHAVKRLPGVLAHDKVLLAAVNECLNLGIFGGLVRCLVVDLLDGLGGKVNHRRKVGKIHGQVTNARAARKLKHKPQIGGQRQRQSVFGDVHTRLGCTEIAHVGHQIMLGACGREARKCRKRYAGFIRARRIHCLQCRTFESLA